MLNKFVSILTLTSALTATLAVLPATAQAKDWYLGGSLGYNTTSDQTSTGDNRQVETEFKGGIATTSTIGVKLENNLRFEGEFAWRRNDGKTLAFNDIDRPGFTSKGAQSYGVLINGYYDFDTGGSVTPYIGAGIGFDLVENEFLYGAVDFEDNAVVLAWQAMAGISKPLTEKIDVFVDARYHSAVNPKFTRTSPADTGFELDSEYDNITISVGYRYKIGRK